MLQSTINSKMMKNVLKEYKNKKNSSSYSNNNFNKRKLKLEKVEEEELLKVHISKKHLSLSSNISSNSINSIIKRNINSNRNTNLNISQRGLLLNKKMLAKNNHRGRGAPNRGYDRGRGGYRGRGDNYYNHNSRGGRGRAYRDDF